MAQSRANGSHYALTAIGLGMLVLGIIMAVWNLVPGFGLADKPSTHAGNSSKPEHGTGGILKSKTFSVAYVLVGAGVLLLLLSICLNIRDKKRQNEDIVCVQHQAPVEPSHQEDRAQEKSPAVSVPGAGCACAERGRGAGTTWGVRWQEETTAPPGAAGAEPGTERQPGRHSSRLSKRLKPLKVRRIKSEKLHLKDIRLNLAEGNSTAPITIEPLTPPPKYEEIQEKAPESQQMT
ncbi:TMM51 protein, partial [Ciconia maguari]|nr:TMM51 protein [Ciconia maguari]